MDRNIYMKDVMISFPLQQGVVVPSVSLTLRAGSVVALVGESGSGKSVIGKSIVGLLEDAAISGSIQYNQKELVSASDRELSGIRGKEIFFMPQDPVSSLNPTLTIGEQLQELVEFHCHIWGREAKEKVLAALYEFGFHDAKRVYHSYPFQLSGGMNQRVLCSMAYLLEPHWIIGDEPTKGLDAVLRRQVYEVFQQLKEKVKCGIILITHDLRLAYRLSDTMVVLQQGRVVEQGLTKVLMEEPQSEYLRLLMHSQYAFQKESE